MTATMPRPAARSVPRSTIWAVMEWNLIGARRWWRSVVLVSGLTPILYMLALGVGLGTLVDRHGEGRLGVSYLAYVGPALVTAAAAQLGAGESTYPIMAGFKWVRFFHGMAASPLTPRQIADGTLVWTAVRLTVNSGFFLAILAAFGGVERWQVAAAVPAAVLTGMALAGPISAYSATREHEGQAFLVIMRFIVTPMFLFSGTFYPISELPAWGRWLAWVSPLWHGTELARGAAIGGLSGGGAVGHVAYLIAWTVAGVVLTRWQFARRLAK
jgi:lipooligosaccharide transport system permease protein